MDEFNDYGTMFLLNLNDKVCFAPLTGIFLQIKYCDHNLNPQDFYTVWESIVCLDLGTLW